LYFEPSLVIRLSIHRTWSDWIEIDQSVIRHRELAGEVLRERTYFEDTSQEEHPVLRYQLLVSLPIQLSCTLRSDLALNHRWSISQNSAHHLSDSKCDQTFIEKGVTGLFQTLAIIRALLPSTFFAKPPLAFCVLLTVILTDSIFLRAAES
jgi:hypothetical protein